MRCMNILSWLLFGLIVGIVAQALDPHPTRGGAGKAIALGVAGAFLGGALANFLFGISVTGFSLTAFVIAVAVSLLLLFFGRNIQKV